VSLTTKNCDLQGIHTSFRDTIIEFCNHTPTVYTTHSWLCNYDTLWTQPATSYKWFAYGDPLPETRQFLPNYSQYSLSGFSVISTLNNCSELSKTFNGFAQYSGYYFDLRGTPCNGNTAKFVVLNINGSLSGTEHIRWYRNDTLLPSMNNKDTLYITSSGKYKCKVIDQSSNCPFDTTSYFYEYNCGMTGIKENFQETSWSLFPNPASEHLTIQFTTHPLQEIIEIYSVTGHLSKVMEASKLTNISVADLPEGLYFVKLKNSDYHPLKFIKQ
jgi:hypothetical protein